MPLRYFDWRDLPTLHNYRDEMVFLHSEWLLTAGSLKIWETVLSSVVPMAGVVTLVYNDERQGNEKTDHGAYARILAQAVHRPGDGFAYLTFLAPRGEIEAGGFLAIVDALTASMGERGALRLLADVDEHSPVFEVLRQAGFSVYARQRIWHVVPDGVGTTLKLPYKGFLWRPIVQADWCSAQSLYTNLVPILTQRIAPPMIAPPRGLVCVQKNEIIAYIELRYGINGICALPYIHPDAAGLPEMLPWVMCELPGLSPRLSRPVYTFVNQTQNWIENALEAQGAQAGASQVLMVKHLTLRQKTLPLLIPALESGQTRTFALSTSGENLYDTSTYYR